MKPKVAFFKGSIKINKTLARLTKKRREKTQIPDEFEMREQISLHTADTKRIISKETIIYNQLYAHKFEK